VRALNSIVEYLDRARRTQFIVDINSNYVKGTKKTKTYFNLTVMPRSSYGYVLGITQDPGGREIKTTTITSVNGGAPTTVDETKYQKSAYKLNLQFLRKIYRTTFRLGLIESSGGVGIDQEFWKDHFFLTAEAFNFGRDNENAQVRALARLQFLDAFYIQGGYEELASKTKKGRDDSLFGGVGIRFNDNELKNFLVFLGF
jgi:phospholipid/cholesterol/gamma-HCH transport system substrate-binding protein